DEAPAADADDRAAEHERLGEEEDAVEDAPVDLGAAPGADREHDDRRHAAAEDRERPEAVGERGVGDTARLDELAEDLGVLEPLPGVVAELGDRQPRELRAERVVDGARLGGRLDAAPDD